MLKLLICFGKQEVLKSCVLLGMRKEVASYIDFEITLEWNLILRKIINISYLHIRMKNCNALKVINRMQVFEIVTVFMQIMQIYVVNNNLYSLILICKSRIVDGRMWWKLGVEFFLLGAAVLTSYNVPTPVLITPTLPCC